QLGIDHGTQVHARRAGRGVLGQRVNVAEPSVEHAHRNGLPRHTHRFAIRSATRATRRRATSTLAPRLISAPPPCQYTERALSQDSKPHPSTPTWLAAIMSSRLRSSLLRACSSTRSVSAANPTTNGRFGSEATSARMSGL